MPIVGDSDFPYLDSVKTYANVADRWIGGTFVQAGAARDGGPALMVGGMGGEAQQCWLPRQYGTVCAGAAFKGWGAAFRLWDPLTGINLTIKSTHDGRLRVQATDPTDTRWFPPVFIDAFTHPFHFGLWNHIGFEASVSGGGMSVSVYINEELIVIGYFNYSHPERFGVDAIVAWSWFAIGGPDGSPIPVCDIFLAGSFLGDCQIACLRPNGDGGKSDWTPYPALGANWYNVSDVTEDGDATTVAAATFDPPLTDLYAFTGIPADVKVKALQGLEYVSVDRPGMNAMHFEYGLLSSAPIFPMVGAYLLYRDGRTDPALLDAGAVNGLRFGQTRTA
jgi:hypothetical protein